MNASPLANEHNTDTAVSQILVFELHQHCFAFEVVDMQAVTRMLEVSPAPRTADFFEGMINLRGQLTPVINLRKLFFFPDQPFDANTRMLAIKGDGHGLVVLADRLTGVLRVPVNALAPPPEMLSNPFIKSVYKSKRELISILNPCSLLDAQEVRQIMRERSKISLFAESEATNPQPQTAQAHESV